MDIQLQEYTAVELVRIQAGAHVRLSTEDQYRRRKLYLEPVADGVYRLTNDVWFKAGETFATDFDLLPKGRVGVPKVQRAGAEPDHGASVRSSGEAETVAVGDPEPTASDHDDSGAAASADDADKSDPPSGDDDDDPSDPPSGDGDDVAAGDDSGAAASGNDEPEPAAPAPAPKSRGRGKATKA